MRHFAFLCALSITLGGSGVSWAATPGGSGQAPAGGASHVLKDQFLDMGPYMVNMQKKIHDNWKEPKNLKCVRIKFQIQTNGAVTGLRVDKSSGDPGNDKAAVDAVALSSPFAPLPKGVGSMPIEYTFDNVQRSGMEQIPMSERVASQALSNMAVDLVNKKMLAEGMDNVEFAFDRDPKNPNLSNILRAISAYTNDDTPDNIHLLYRVLAMDPQQYAALEKLRVLLRAKGVDPDSASQRMARGEELLQQQDPFGAIVEFTAANSIAPGVCPASKTVDAYRVMAGHRMASKWLTVVKTHKDADSLCGLGRSYQLAGDYDKAEKYYKEAHELQNDSAMPTALLAKLEEERKTGVKEKTDTVVAEHLTGAAGKNDLIPRAHLLNDEGVDDLKRGDVEAAVEKFKKAIIADPLCAPAKRNLSMTLNNRGAKMDKPEDAANCYRQALYLNPANDVARKNLSSYVKWKGKNPDSFEDRMALSNEFAAKGDFIAATVEVQEALSKKKDTVASAKLKEYQTKAPALP
jgi:TonB family protein